MRKNPLVPERRAIPATTKDMGGDDCCCSIVKMDGCRTLQNKNVYKSLQTRIHLIDGNYLLNGDISVYHQKGLTRYATSRGICHR